MELSSVQVPENEWNCWNFVHKVQFLYIKIAEKLELNSVQALKKWADLQELGSLNQVPSQLCYPPYFLWHSRRWLTARTPP